LGGQESLEILGNDAIKDALLRIAGDLTPDAFTDGVVLAAG
jgi:hypothetical protein